MRFDKTVKKIVGFGKPNTVDIKAAEAASKQRALEQRAIVIDQIEKRHLLEINPNGKRFADFYGQTDAPAQMMPANLTTKGAFITTENNLDNAGTVAAGAITVTNVGSAGLNTIGPITRTDPATGVSATGVAFDANNDAEFILAESIVGVGTDYFFDKPSFAQGDIYSTRISGFLRFTNELGGNPPTATGFINNGMMRLKMISPQDQGKVAAVIWECSTDKFNAPAQTFIAAAGAPQSPHHLNYMLYPNFQVPKVIPAGSKLQLTITGLFDSPTATLDGGGAVDLTAFGGSYIDGSRSQFNIATHRIEYFQGGSVPQY